MDKHMTYLSGYVRHLHDTGGDLVRPVPASVGANADAWHVACRMFGAHPRRVHRPIMGVVDGRRMSFFSALAFDQRK